MTKQLVRVFFLIIAVALVGYGGYYVYIKQTFKIHHNSFNSIHDGQTIYIPEVQHHITEASLISTLEQFNMPGMAAELLKPVFFNNIGSVQAVFNDADFVLSFQGLSRAAFKKIYGVELTGKAGTTSINNQTTNYSIDKGFLVVSNQPITIDNSAEVLKYEGNADFFYAHNGNNSAYKVKENFVFNAILKSDQLKGGTISPYNILSNCPIASDSIYLYGSSRFLDDATILFGTKNQNFYNWVDQAVVYLQKDSFDILIGNQNEYANLKNQLEEMTLNQSADSLLPEKVYLNNFEIMPFIFDGNWEETFPQTKQGFKYYSAYDNQIFLANSIPAMYWLLREIQLGNTYERDKLLKKVTSGLNKLTIYSAKNKRSFNIESRIKKGLSIHLNSDESGALNDSLSMISNFDFSFLKPVSNLKLIGTTSERKVIIRGPDFITLRDFSGKELWENTYENNISGYDIVMINGETRLFLIEGKKLHQLTLEGEEVQGFPFESNSVIHQLKVIKYDEANVRILINTQGTIQNISLSGQEVEGWVKPENIGTLSEQMEYNSVHDLDFIFCVTPQDSLIVLNRKGERRYAKTYQCQLVNPSNFISGKTNLSSARLLGFKNGFIHAQYLETGLIDSVSLNARFTPDAVHWVEFKGKKLLCIELFDKLMLYNEFGILEFELIKPVNNSKFIEKESVKDGVFVFFNLQTNRVYLLDEYGNLMHKTPLSGTSIVSYNKPYFTTVVDKKVIIHKL